MVALVLSLSNCSNKKRAMTTEPGKSTLPSNSSSVGGTGTQSTGTAGTQGTQGQPGDLLNSTIQPKQDGQYVPGASSQAPNQGGVGFARSMQEFISTAAGSSASVLSYLIGANSSEWKVKVESAPTN